MDLFAPPSDEEIAERKRCRKKLESYREYLSAFQTGKQTIAYLTWCRTVRKEQRRLIEFERTGAIEQEINQYEYWFVHLFQTLMVRGFAALYQEEVDKIRAGIRSRIEEEFAHPSSLQKCHGLYLGSEMLKYMHPNFLLNLIEEVRPGVLQADLRPTPELLLKWNYESLARRKERYCDCRHHSSSVKMVKDIEGNRCDVLTCEYCWRQAWRNEDEIKEYWNAPGNAKPKVTYSYGKDQPWLDLNEAPRYY